MKKYSDEHLEKVPPEFIAGLENILTAYSACSICVLALTKTELLCSEFSGSGRSDTCPKFLGYKGLNCPCEEFGPEEALIMAANLITQWKQWAGITAPK